VENQQKQPLALKEKVDM